MSQLQSQEGQLVPAIIAERGIENGNKVLARQAALREEELRHRASVDHQGADQPNSLVDLTQQAIQTSVSSKSKQLPCCQRY